MLRSIVYSSTLTIFVLLTACSSKQRDESPITPAPTPTQATSESASPAQAGVQVFVDPITGEIRDPTAVELAAIARRQAAKPNTATTQKPAREIHLPDGTVAVEMDQSTDEPLQACRDKTGQITVSHDCAAPTKDHQP